jgi:hypothetical protein
MAEGAEGAMPRRALHQGARRQGRKGLEGPRHTEPEVAAAVARGAPAAARRAGEFRIVEPGPAANNHRSSARYHPPTVHHGWRSSNRQSTPRRSQACHGGQRRSQRSCPPAPPAGCPSGCRSRRNSPGSRRASPRRRVAANSRPLPAYAAYSHSASLGRR